MADEPESPPKTSFAFKPREFTPVNAPVHATPPAERIDVRSLVKSATPEGPVLRREKPASVENEVHAFLRQNARWEEAVGINALKPLAVRKSKRLRDYFLLLISFNLLFGAVLVAGLRAHDIVTTCCAGAGMIFLSISVTWIMWYVMDDY